MSAQLISLPVAAAKHGSVCAPFTSLTDGQLEHEIKFLEDTVQPLRQFLMSVPGVRSLATNAAVARAARQLNEAEAELAGAHAEQEARKLPSNVIRLFR